MDGSMLDKRRGLSYVKVGVFFLAGFLLFFVTLLAIKEVPFFKGTYPLTVSFDFAEGLRPSSPVRYCGVYVGEVKEVTIEEGVIKPVVHVRVAIKKDVRIPKHSDFIINSLSLFGEKYLEIIPPETIKGYVTRSDIVEGLSPIPLASIFAHFTSTMQEVGSLIREGEIKTSLQNSLANIEDITLGLKNVIEDTRNSSGTIGRLLYDDSLYEITEELMLDLKSNPWKLLKKAREEK